MKKQKNPKQERARRKLLHTASKFGGKVDAQKPFMGPAEPPGPLLEPAADKTRMSGRSSTPSSDDFDDRSRRLPTEIVLQLQQRLARLSADDSSDTKEILNLVSALSMNRNVDINEKRARLEEKKIALLEKSVALKEQQVALAREANAQRQKKLAIAEEKLALQKQKLAMQKEKHEAAKPRPPRRIGDEEKSEKIWDMMGIPREERERRKKEMGIISTWGTPDWIMEKLAAEELAETNGNFQ